MAEVRRAYRQLVQKYHPDINPDPSAAIIIREINEAYETLGDEQKKRVYDSTLVTPAQTIQADQSEFIRPVRYRDPYFRRTRSHPVFKRPRQYDLIMRYFYLVKIVSLTGLGVCLILLIDYNLPERQHISDFRVDFAAGRNYILTPEKTIAVVREEAEPFENLVQIELIESRLLGIVRAIKSVDGKYSITTFVTVYGIFKFVPIIVFITSVICLLMKNNFEFRFGLSVLTAFTLFCTLILMFN